MSAFNYEYNAIINMKHAVNDNSAIKYCDIAIKTEILLYCGSKQQQYKQFKEKN